jgi:thymidylate synthase ThyX
LVHFEPDAEGRALAAAGVRFRGWSYADALERVRTESTEGKGQLAEALLGLRGRHDAPMRELEYVGYTFEGLMDQGAYFEVKRHRMASQTPGPLTCRLGYLTPRWIGEAGFLGEYGDAMRKAAAAYRTLHAVLGPDAAAYLVPNGYLRRLVLGMNLREAFHFCSLRSSESAHAAVRILALQAAEQIRMVHPLLSAYMKTEVRCDWRELEREFFLTP